MFKSGQEWNLSYWYKLFCEYNCTIIISSLWLFWYSIKSIIILGHKIYFIWAKNSFQRICWFIIINTKSDNNMIHIQHITFTHKAGFKSVIFTRSVSRWQCTCKEIWVQKSITVLKFPGFLLSRELTEINLKIENLVQTDSCNNNNFAYVTFAIRIFRCDGTQLSFFCPEIKTFYVVMIQFFYVTSFCPHGTS